MDKLSRAWFFKISIFQAEGLLTNLHKNIIENYETIQIICILNYSKIYRLVLFME